MGGYSSLEKARRSLSIIAWNVRSLGCLCLGEVAHGLTRSSSRWNVASSNAAFLAPQFHAPLRLVTHNLRNSASQYFEKFTDPNGMVGYTILVNYYSSFPEGRLELGETVFQIHANGVSEKTNPAFADITDQ